MLPGECWVSPCWWLASSHSAFRHDDVDRALGGLQEPIHPHTAPAIRLAFSVPSITTGTPASNVTVTVPCSSVRQTDEPAADSASSVKAVG